MSNFHEKAVFYEMLDEVMSAIKDKASSLEWLKRQFSESADKSVSEQAKYYSERENAVNEIYSRIQDIFR